MSGTETRIALMREMLAASERRPDRSAVANDLAVVLERHYGPLLLSERYGAANAAIDLVVASRDQHAAWLREQIAKQEP